ncbi:MAG TPA: VOC family protein [Firmicutes bacterium]|nr:VOC family protein [Bacillota bacterium]
MQFHRPPAIYPASVQLKATDLKRSLEFYQEIVGFKVFEESSSHANLGADGKTAILSLVQPEDVVPKQGRTTGLYHFALRLPERSHLGLFVKHLAEKGIEFGAADHLVSEAIYFEDPDKNGIEVYVDTDPESWEWTNGDVNMDTLPLDLDSLLEEAEQSSQSWAGLPGSTIVGHIHLHVSNLVQAETFYAHGLGFEVVLRFRGSASFLSTEKYHHHVGVNIWNGVDAPRPPKHSAGLDHFTLVFPSQERLEQAVFDLSCIGAYVENVDGKHFVEDPSGNGIVLTAVS